MVVDVQRGFNTAAWGRRNNPDCEANIVRLIDCWRADGAPLVYVRHDSREPGSPLAPGGEGNRFKDALSGEPDLVVTKSVHSAFHGSPDLATWLRERDVEAIVVCGITANHCCETTARVGADLGFAVTFASDATHTFDRRAPDGTMLSAEELQRATEANLADEFAVVATTKEITAARRGDRNAAAAGATDGL